jgi:hypothetical protein
MTKFKFSKQNRLVKVVSPVKTGVQCFYNYLKLLDSGFRRNDDISLFSTFYDFIKQKSLEILNFEKLNLFRLPARSRFGQGRDFDIRNSDF